MAMFSSSAFNGQGKLGFVLSTDTPNPAKKFREWYANMSCDPLDCGCVGTLFEYRSDDQVFTSTQSYTAECPDGYTGEPVTISATRTSIISQADADALALAAATEEAIAALECNPTDCCLYSASQLGVLYTEDDLPDTIVLHTGTGDTPPSSTITLTRSGTVFTGSGASVSLVDGAWHSDSSTSLYDFDCLIVPDPSPVDFAWIADEFPTNLTIDGGVEMVRDGLCAWYLLTECDPGEIAAAGVWWEEASCKWYFFVQVWDDDCETTGHTTTMYSGYKDSGTQSSPAGTYGGYVVS